MTWKDVFEIFILYELITLVIKNIKYKVQISVYEELYGILGINVDRVKSMTAYEIIKYFLTK